MYSNRLICSILYFIDENIDRKISISDISERFFYNRYYVMKLFKKEIGVSIVSYINNIRVYNSAFEIINDSGSSMLRVGLDNGFCSLEYFSEIFKSIIGVSPSVYRKFVLNRDFVSDDERMIISNNFTELREFVLKKEDYLRKEKPDNVESKKLTIFK